MGDNSYINNEVPPVGSESQESSVGAQLRPVENKKAVGDWRLRAALRGNLEFVIGNAGNLDIQGKEHLEELDPNKKTVVAPGHANDIAVQAVTYALLKLGVINDPLIANQSTQYDRKIDPFSYIGTKIAGREHFAPVGYRPTEKGKPSVASPINVEDFKSIAEQAAAGKTPIIAAYNPVYDGKTPEKGGYGAVLTAQFMGADQVQVLPMSFIIDSKEQTGMAGDKGTILKNIVKRPNGHVIVGKPIVLDPIEDIEALFTKEGGSISDNSAEDSARFNAARAKRRSIKAKLDAQSQQIMQELRPHAVSSQSVNTEEVKKA